MSIVECLLWKSPTGFIAFSQVDVGVDCKDRGWLLTITLTITITTTTLIILIIIIPWS